MPPPSRGRHKRDLLTLNMLNLPNGLFDSHAHLNDKAFDGKLDVVIENAKKGNSRNIELVPMDNTKLFPRLRNLYLMKDQLKLL